eukprot:CAMPEP_0116945662 /NCGR_PEP_ID=MMETSP0467-20121206/36501_1 /TAXON_ID=283647 /ORGANISM="Mesodinium pulex, Strain SPMC105" /LENGTH=250 /DNA_ID=CAMNT_0004629247 /DNA_START=22 /DNA_END=774 /DNA_ORIENTATION=+
MSRSRSRSPDRGAARDAAPADDSCKLFIGNLSFETQVRDLEDAFSRYGKVVDARVMTDRDTGRPKGFGFVTFDSAASCEDAITGMNGFELQGREIRVDKATPRGSGPGPRREFGAGGRGGGGFGGDRACHDFERGNCRYGDSCKFSHGGAGGGGGGGDRPRYDDRAPRGGYDDRRGGYDDRRGGRDDDRRGGRDDYRGGGGGYDDRRGGGAPRGGYDDRRGGRDDYRAPPRDAPRDYDDRRGGRDAGRYY